MSSRTPWILGALAIAALVLVWLLPPIAQSAAYHAFADTRRVWGIPNAWNVLSNLPFVAAGAWGLGRAVGARDVPARAAWIVTFAGIALVSAGSAWYHLSPSDDTLVWDRLPMTIGFMGLIVAVLADHLGERAAARLLVPAVLVGIGSVAFWNATGDLRPYVWVQFTPLAMIAVLLVLDRRPSVRRRALLAAIVLYGLAKVFELADPQIYAALGGLVSGHTLKHLSAAAACAALVPAIGGRAAQGS